MSVSKAYDNWSETYDNDINRTRDLDEQVTRKMLDKVIAARVLETGCGTGKNTVWLSERFRHVTAFDFSEGMLEQARGKVKKDNTVFIQTDLTAEWPVETGSTDLVVCNLVLEHIKDLKFIFSEAGRALKKGGGFYIGELHPFRQYQGTKARFEREEQTIEINAFIHNISDFLNAASENNFTLENLNEWWHQDDEGKPPRLITFLFRKN